ncbi:MAG TPA: AMP-binding protein, partial [Candidatus Acidoferrales bacterium]|nr:AMP-binding protein [Candidatus Acidoferrales bacterium]
MATTSRQIDVALLRERVVAEARALLVELGNTNAAGIVRATSHLERDLGLGSLERVELMVRLDRAFHVRLDDSAVAKADLLEDLATSAASALQRELEVEPLLPKHSGAPQARNSAWDFAAVRNYEPTSVAAGTIPGHAAGVPLAKTLNEVLRYRAENDGDRPHIFYYEGDEAREPVTFGELFCVAQRVAQVLSERSVAPGDTVCLMLPTCREFFYCFAGILLAGAVPVPIYPPVRADRIEEYAEKQIAILNNARARLMITFDRAERVARLLAPRVQTLRGVVNANELVAAKPKLLAPGAMPAGQAARSETDLALLQYTSGSTGDPKGVMLTHANLLANIRAIGDAAGITQDDVCTSWLPLYHDMGLIGAWMVPLYFGLPLAVVSPMDFLSRPERWLKMIHRHRGTLAAAPNFAYELCARKIPEVELNALDLTYWRAALNGAETVLPETLERFADRFARCGFRREALLPVYGLAECALALTVPVQGRPARIDAIERDALSAEGRAVPVASENCDVSRFVSVGAPLTGYEIKIADAQGHDAGERREGTLWFRGPSATQGYFNNTSATAALFLDAPPADGGAPWVNSGDRAYWADGEIFITGRAKDIIIKAGRNLYPHEIETLAARVPEIRRGCVIAFAACDAKTGTEKLVIVAEVREPALLRDPERKSEVCAAIGAEVFGGISVPPDAVELLPPGSLPKTSSGKLRRAETRQRYLAAALGRSDGAAWMQVSRLAWAGFRERMRSAVVRGGQAIYGLYVLLVFLASIVPTWTLVKISRSRKFSSRVTRAGLR